MKTKEKFHEISTALLNIQSARFFERRLDYKSMLLAANLREDAALALESVGGLLRVFAEWQRRKAVDAFETLAYVHRYNDSHLRAKLLRTGEPITDIRRREGTLV